MGVGRLTLAPGAAVFLDRDGTLSRAFIRDGISYAPTRVDELALLPGVPEAVHALKEAGFRLVVVTNQPDVKRGDMTLETAQAINAALWAQLPEIDALQVCFHDNVDVCACRKPKPGMITDAAAKLRLDVSHSFVVGDSWRDTEAGQRVGCTTVQLRTEAWSTRGSAEPDFWAADVAEASEIILSQLCTNRSARD